MAMSNLTIEDVRLTFLVNHAAFFVSHRLPLALAARRAGIAVDLITGQAGSKVMEPAAEAKLAQAGLRHRRVGFTSASINPITESIGLAQLFRLLKASKPDILHCASPKALIYGGIMARVARVPALVFSISGQGYMQTFEGNRSLKRRVIGAVGRQLTRLAFAHKRKRIWRTPGKSS
jgi:Glycosyl transferase 4-like